LNTAAIGIALAYMREVTSLIDTHLKSTGWSNIFNVERSPRASSGRDIYKFHVSASHHICPSLILLMLSNF